MDFDAGRIGHNEAAFRTLNEKLRAGSTLADAERLFCFRCECGTLGCNRLLELTLPEYEAVRAEATRFFLVPGHEIPATERVVQRAERFTVVEKQHGGADVARATDPRG